MTSLLISEFKAKCIAVLNEVHQQGGTVVVTRRGVPLAKIVPMDSRPGVRVLGGMEGEVVVTGDIVHGRFAKDWENA